MKLTIIILITNIIASLALADDFSSFGRDTDCNECPLELEILIGNANLGRFLSDMQHDLPASDGTGNELEFMLHGDSREKYDFSFEMELKRNMSSGYAEIIGWTWEKADNSTNGLYGMPEYNRTRKFRNIKLYKPDKNHKCKSYAKFKMTALRMFVSQVASSQDLTFKITVRATVNI